MQLFDDGDGDARQPVVPNGRQKRVNKVKEVKLTLLHSSARTYGTRNTDTRRCVEIRNGPSSIDGRLPPHLATPNAPIPYS